MPVEERYLVTTLVEPCEVAPGIHQSQHEHPTFASYAVELECHFEKVNLRLVACMVNEGHEDLRVLTTPLAPVLSHGGEPYAEALISKLPVQSRRCDALLARCPIPPFLDQFVESRANLLRNWTSASCTSLHRRLRLPDVFPNRNAAYAHFFGDSTLASPFH